MKIIHKIAIVLPIANGSLVVGQEQDRLGGGFSESEAFLGKLGLLDMWDVVLEESSVTELWNSCEKYHGNLVGWAQVRQYIRGDIVVITYADVNLSKASVRFQRQIQQTNDPFRFWPARSVAVVLYRSYPSEGTST